MNARCDIGGSLQAVFWDRRGQSYQSQTGTAAASDDAELRQRSLNQAPCLQKHVTTRYLGPEKSPGVQHHSRGVLVSLKEKESYAALKARSD